MKGARAPERASQYLRRHAFFQIQTQIICMATGGGLRLTQTFRRRPEIATMR